MNSIRMVQTSLSAGAAVLVVGLMTLTVLLPFRWVFFVALAGWIAVFLPLLRRLARISGQTASMLPVAAATTLASFLLLLLVEWRPLRWFVIVLSGGAAALLVSLTLGHRGSRVFEWKRARRLFVMLWALDAFSAATMLYAIAIFFPHVPLFLLAPAGGAVFAGASFMIWRLYHDIGLRSHAPWVVAAALIMTELSWAMNRLPFGPFAAGFLTAWLWYLMTLFARFHFSPQGILWKQQRWFLLINAILYLAALTFFIRWV